MTPNDLLASKGEINIFAKISGYRSTIARPDVGYIVGCFFGALVGFCALIFLILWCILYKNSKRSAQQQEEPFTPTRPHELSLVPPATAPPAPETPSAPPRAPPAPPRAPPALSASPAPLAPSAPRAQEEAAPPAYEEAENYPLVRAAEAAPPPYKDHESYTVLYTSS